jgi:hypothetical protein
LRLKLVRAELSVICLDFVEFLSEESLQKDLRGNIKMIENRVMGKKL